MSLVVRKPAFCICENKVVDQLRSNCAADQRLCFRYTDNTIPLLPKSEISSLSPSSVALQPGSPEDRFSHNEAQMPLNVLKKTDTISCYIVMSVHDIF